MARRKRILTDKDIEFIKQAYDKAAEEGWTFQEYAKKAGCSASTISTWCYATNEGLDDWCAKKNRKQPRGPMLSTLMALGKPFGLIPTFIEK